jgi:hypothetical protein
MTERRLEDFAIGEKLSRRSLVARATFFGAAMAAIGDVAKAQEDGSGSYSNADRFARQQRRCENPRGANPRRQDRTRHARGAAQHYRARDGR